MIHPSVTPSGQVHDLVHRTYTPAPCGCDRYCPCCGRLRTPHIPDTYWQNPQFHYVAPGVGIGNSTYGDSVHTLTAGHTIN